jgi:hypothetical protein
MLFATQGRPLSLPNAVTVSAEAACLARLKSEKSNRRFPQIPTKTYNQTTSNQPHQQPNNQWL